MNRQRTRWVKRRQAHEVASDTQTGQGPSLAATTGRQPPELLRP